MFQYLVLTYFIDVIALGFNYDVLKGLGNKPFHVFTDHVQMVNIPTQLSGSLIDYVYIMKVLMKNFFANATVESVYFSHLDASYKCYK